MKDYLSIEPISRPIPPVKGRARRHYGSHPYFTKRAWNVVQEYIQTFSDREDLVLDPFGGAGITAVEALVLRRRAIHLDIAPFANFMTQQIARSPVDLSALSDAFDRVSDASKASILGLYEMPDEEIDRSPIPGWYPRDFALPSNSDVETVEACFHRRSLIALSILLEAITSLQDPESRELMRLAFAATLVSRPVDS